MTYDYYHKVIKGTAPKNAPTYRATEAVDDHNDGEEFICTICGYVAEKETLPEGYQCPICRANRDKFVKL